MDTFVSSQTLQNEIVYFAFVSFIFPNSVETIRILD